MIQSVFTFRKYTYDKRRRLTRGEDYFPRFQLLYLLSCSALCGRETSCRRANFLENQRLCYLLRGEMQTSSATGHLYQRDGSIYLTKVFAIDDMLQF